MKYFRILSALALISAVSAHARLIDPASRSSMWRFGFPTPVNYDDNELFCGGFAVQHQTNHGRCGVCGDPYNLPQPRPNEAGGKYAKGIIVRRYTTGQVINITVDVTANHLGYFEFHICPHNNPKKIVAQDCLDKYPLPIANSISYKYHIQPEYLGIVTVPVKLPKDVVCTQCVLQWQYRGANNWGTCVDGSQGLGCGPQENFRACADVAISEDIEASTELTTNSEDVIPVSKLTTSLSTGLNIQTSEHIFTVSPIATTPSLDVMYSTRSTQVPEDRSSVKPTVPNKVLKEHCKGVSNMLSVIPGLDYWCRANCAMGHCPSNMCECELMALPFHI